MKVSVKAPSRLHLAMLDLEGNLGRKYGSIGVAIDHPCIKLTAEISEEVRVEGSRAERAKQYAETILDKYKCEGGVIIKIFDDIPEHSGFGSGTQLALSVGMAISHIYGLGCTEEKIALDLGRSKRSGIGTYAFTHGGFIVDGGHSIEKHDGIPPLLFQSSIPDDWCFIIGLPAINTARSGDRENNAFKIADSPPASLVAEASHIVLMQMMPALLEQNIEAFGSSMTRLDSIFGGFWEKIQGGRYSHKVIEEGVNFLQDMGAYGIGQSSWGPAFYGLFKKRNSNKVEKALHKLLNSEGRSGLAFTAYPNNCGARIEVS